MRSLAIVAILLACAAAEADPTVNLGGVPARVQAGEVVNLVLTIRVPPTDTATQSGITAAYDRQPGCAWAEGLWSQPFRYQFTNQTETWGAPCSYLWSFGDGGGSSDTNPQHDYLTPGTYTVSLTATNTGGSDTCTKQGYVNLVAVTPPASGDRLTLAVPTLVPGATYQACFAVRAG